MELRLKLVKSNYSAITNHLYFIKNTNSYWSIKRLKLKKDFEFLEIIFSHW